MAGMLRKVLKIFAFPVFVGLWIVGWSIYSIGANERLEKGQKILIIKRNAIKKEA